MQHGNPYEPSTPDRLTKIERRDTESKAVSLPRRLALAGAISGFLFPVLISAYFLFREPTAADLAEETGTGASGVVAVFVLLLVPFLVPALACFGYLVGRDVEKNGRW